MTKPDNPTSTTPEKEESTTSTTATEKVPSAASDKPAGVQLAAAIKLDQIDVAIKGGKVEKDDQEVSEVGHLYYVIDSDGVTKSETVVASDGCGQKSRDAEEGMVKDETAQPPPNGSISVQTNS